MAQPNLKTAVSFAAVGIGEHLMHALKLSHRHCDKDALAKTSNTGTGILIEGGAVS